jgi:ElaB/YqjD/DUF883 family membrane-anchored ribosome-binding protein
MASEYAGAQTGGAGTSDRPKSAEAGNEIAALRRQVSELIEQAQSQLSQSAGSVIERAGAMASDGVQDVKDNLTGAVATAIEKRPYMTLAILVGLGFLLARLR